MKESTKRKLLIAVLLIFLPYFEVLENWGVFANYLPRGDSFGVVFTMANIKILLLPVLKLLLVTFVCYFIPNIIITHIIYEVYQSLRQRRISKIVLILLSIFSFYSFFYMIYGINAFLFPDTVNRHYLIYSWIFPHFNPYEPVTMIYKSVFLFFAGYWLILIGYFLSLRIYRFAVCLGLAVCFSGIACINTNKKVKKFDPAPHMIFVGLDSFQWNTISKEWGYPKDIAPTTSEFLKDSVCFKNAWTPFARTNPSYMSMLTSRYPVNNGYRANLLPQSYGKKDNQYLGNILKKYGYYRFHATDDVRFSNIRPFHGFDECYSPRKDFAGMLLTSFYDFAFTNIMIYNDIFPWFFDSVLDARSHYAYNPENFIKHVIQRLNNVPHNQPQFIVIHLCANHHPYISSYKYARDTHLNTRLEKCVRMADDQLKELLNFFKESGLYESSTIFLYSDHGSGFEDGKPGLVHGTDFNKLCDYRTMIAVHGKNFPEHKVIDSLASNMDMYPTALELLGLSVPSDIDGISLLTLLDNKPEPERLLFAESGYSYKYSFTDNYDEQDAGVSKELKKFRVDPTSGFVYITSKDYEELINKKWYCVFNGKIGLKMNPLLGEKKLFKMVNGKAISIENQDMERNLQSYLDAYRKKGEIVLADQASKTIADQVKRSQ